MYTAYDRFSDASALLSAIESRTVREGRRAFAWQMAQRARRTRPERSDLLIPDGMVRDKSGAVVGCVNFSRV